MNNRDLEERIALLEQIKELEDNLTVFPNGDLERRLALLRKIAELEDGCK